MTKVRSYVMLLLPNMTMELSNVKEKKNESTTKCDKRTVRYDIGTAQCDNEIVKCEKTIMVPPNVTKI